MVHEETASNDVTDYTDWSTYEGDGWYLFFYARSEYFFGVCSNLKCSIQNFFLCQQHRTRATFTQAILITPATAQCHQQPPRNRKIMQVLVKTGPRSTLWSTFPLPLVIQLQYTQVKLRKMYKFVSFSSFTGRFLDDLCFWITCFCCCSASSPRKLYDTRDTSHSSVTQIDFDDDKYRRRPALSWFAQILK